MKRLISVIVVALLSIGVTAQEFKSGLIAGAGIGFIENLKYDRNGEIDDFLKNGGVGGFSSSKSGVFIGYKLRMTYPQKSFFYDFDLYAGARFTEYNYYRITTPSPGTYTFPPSGKVVFYSLSVNPSINYRVWQNLYAGAGIAPTLYYRQAKSNGWAFDIPLTPRIGYGFGSVDIALSYKLGLLNSPMNFDGFDGGRLSGLDIQLFISF